MVSLLSYRLTLAALSDLDVARQCPALLEGAWVRAREAAVRSRTWLQSAGADRPGPLIILSDGTPSELSLAWQAILSEVGVATPICLDVKDYTHGDHASAGRAGDARYIVLRHAGNAAICRRFVERFSSLYDVFEVDLMADPAYLFWVKSVYGM